ncbi:MAG: hypothetical protein LIO59_03890 [Oscillospiraceae bacterium]|nr:hypothetical protein [Oscillospiraceae bacterium]
MDTTKRKSVIVLMILQALVIATAIAEAVHGNFYNVFLCALTTLLFNIPRFVNIRLNIYLLTALEIVILLFIFAAEILGEIQSFYTIFSNWDTILHTINGFIMAAIGFALIDILNQAPNIHFNMSPIFVAFVAFCFSMTVGVLWEFYEFAADYFFHTDMQKDFIVNTISSVSLNPSGLNETVKIKNIASTVVNGVMDGSEVQYVIEGGYLDVGIIDTMKDLIVNCIGALIFSVIGVFYIKKRGKKNNFLWRIVPRMKTKEEIEATEEYINRRKRLKK